MQIAARWVGWCGLTLGAAAAMAALYVQRDAAAPVPKSESWRELTYRTFVAGLECRMTPEENDRARIENEEALADCLDTWEGNFAIHPFPRAPERANIKVLIVEDHSPLSECMRIRNNDTPFCHTGWARPPADAHQNVPLHLGDARPHVTESFRREREREAAALADGAIVALECPTRAASTSVGLPSKSLQRALWSCHQDRGHGWFRVALDETGAVSRVITSPGQLMDVPCVMEHACGLRFAGLGTGLTF